MDIQGTSNAVNVFNEQLPAYRARIRDLLAKLQISSARPNFSQGGILPAHSENDESTGLSVGNNTGGFKPYIEKLKDLPH